MAFLRTDLKRSLFALFLLSFILLAGLFLFRKGRAHTEMLTVYTVVFETDEAALAALSVGDALIDACGKEAAGEVLAITAETALGEDAFGVYEKDGRVCVKLSVLAKGEKTESGVRIGTLTARAGERLYLYGRGRIEGLCVRVRAL